MNDPIPPVVPRWEWRCFGDRFGDAEAAFAALTPDQVVESSELYLVSAAGSDVVKVRDDLMDIKQLRAVDDDGLEQWTPVLKASFPLSGADVEAVAAALDVAVPSLGAEGLAREALLDVLVEPNPGVAAVEVRKRRVRYRLHGCLAELTEVWTDHAHTRTVAVEDEDPAVVVATLGEVGLVSRPNVNFGRGLRVLERFGDERYAVIDVGTNSVKFHIGERQPDGSWRSVVDRAVVTRLGDGIRESGRLGEEPMSRTSQAIEDMAEEARRHRVAAIAAVGTAGMRAATNSADFIAAVEGRCGVHIEVISGEDEARLAYQAVTAGLQTEGTSVVFDTGGGSSQFTFGSADGVDERFSVPVGAVRVTEEHGLDRVVSDEDLDDTLEAISSELSRLDERPVPDLVLALGGAVTNLAAVKHGLVDYDPDRVQGTVLDRDEVDRQIDLYRSRTADERRSIPGLQPARAEVILAGACIVRTVLDKLGKDSLTVSDRGLRHGVLQERFGPLT